MTGALLLLSYVALMLRHSNVSPRCRMSNKGRQRWERGAGGGGEGEGRGPGTLPIASNDRMKEGSGFVVVLCPYQDRQLVPQMVVWWCPALLIGQMVVCGVIG